jgi:hypothetical protein
MALPLRGYFYIQTLLDPFQVSISPENAPKAAVFCYGLSAFVAS